MLLLLVGTGVVFSCCLVLINILNLGIVIYTIV